MNQVAILCLTSLILAVLTPSTPLLAGEKLTIYSGRAERLIKPVLDEFTSKTGIQVDLLSSGTTELVNRLKAEGDRTAADLFLTNDAGSLEQARTASLILMAGSVTADYYLNQFLQDYLPKDQGELELSFNPRAQQGSGKTVFHRLRLASRTLPVFFCSTSPSDDQNRTVLVEKVREFAIPIKKWGNL